MTKLRARFQATHMDNQQLKAIYEYLNDDIPQSKLSEDLGKTRTNTYYYIGRAVHYWLQTGVLRWRKDIKGGKDLGGDE